MQYKFPWFYLFGQHHQPPYSISSPTFHVFKDWAWVSYIGIWCRSDRYTLKFWLPNCKSISIGWWWLVAISRVCQHIEICMGCPTCIAKKVVKNVPIKFSYTNMALGFLFSWNDGRALQRTKHAVNFQQSGLLALWCDYRILWPWSAITIYLKIFKSDIVNTMIPPLNLIRKKQNYKLDNLSELQKSSTGDWGHPLS